jgi:hypothetical protein
MHYTRGLCALTVAGILTACGQPPSDPISAAPAQATGQLRALTAVEPAPVSIDLVGDINATREVTQNTNTDYRWALTKTADPASFGTDTARFAVTATLKKTVGEPTTTGTRTVVKGTELKVCNPTDQSLTITTVSATVSGFDGGGAQLSHTVALGGLFHTPFPLNSGECQSVAYKLDTNNPDVSTPALTAADVAFLNTATEFRLDASASGTAGDGRTANGSAVTPKVTPALTTTTTSSETGDRTVTLSDPLFKYSQDISQTTTVPFSRKFTCQDKPGLAPVAGTTDQYTFVNSASLKGANTDLQATATAQITLTCNVGCTYTQGYFKTHAQYKSTGGNLGLNKQYDAGAWKGARNWQGDLSKLMLGGRAYSQQQLFAIYDMSVAGNYAIAVFHQYATVLLNSQKASNPANTSSLSGEIAAAETFFTANPGFLSGAFSSSALVSGYTLSQLNSAFTQFNEALHCPD